MKDETIEKLNQLKKALNNNNYYYSEEKGEPMSVIEMGNIIVDALLELGRIEKDGG